MNNKRLYYLDYLRIISTIAVILLHCFGFLYTNNYIKVNPISVGLINGITRFAVPIFCCISGSIFLDEDRDIKIKDIYIKYIKRLVISLLFWNTVRALVYMFSHNTTFVEFMKLVVVGDYHMWFIYMMIGFYITVPFIRKIVNSKESIEYVLLVLLLVVFVVPESFNIKNIEYIFLSALSSINSNIQFGYIFYFIVGYYISKYQINDIKYRKAIYILGIVGLVITLCLTYLHFDELSTIDKYYSPFKINILFETIALFTLFRYKKIVLENKERALVILSKSTFGAYLVHPRVIKKAWVVFAILNIGNDVIICALLFFTVTVLSLFISLLLNKIPILNKYIV